MTERVSVVEKKYHVANFGCRASQSEGAAVDAELAQAGVVRSASPYDADVLVINSCTVTESADQDVRRLIRRISRRSPEAQIIVTGCYAQRSPEDLAQFPRVRYVVGNSHKAMVGELALECLEDPGPAGRSVIYCSDVFSRQDFSLPSHQGSLGRTRATLKVQDGCNASCSFCVIPGVRGPGRSLELDAVVEGVRDLTARGYREVVYSGIHLGSYGRDLVPRRRLAELLRRTLDEVPELERLRLSSIEPLEVTPEIIALVATCPRVARHLHVPLQSGSARILQTMRRPYGPGQYADLIRRIHEAVPDAAIGADVMVGFPGETDEDFRQTFTLIESLPLTYLHVFPYSPRPGTPAATFEAPVPDHVARFRGRQLRLLITRKNAEFRARFIGRELDVLALGDEGGEEDETRESQAALSDNFIKVGVSGLEASRWHRVRVTGLTAEGLWGIPAGLEGLSVEGLLVAAHDHDRRRNGAVVG